MFHLTKDHKNFDWSYITSPYVYSQINHYNQVDQSKNTCVI
jgi:hypothetical protein